MALESGIDIIGSLGLAGPTLAAFGAAIAVAITGISSAKGLEISGNAAAGVTAEEEKNFSTALILEALPQTQCVYGFIIGILILTGIMGGEMTIAMGWYALAAGIAVGFCGLSAINQGKVAAACIGAAAKNERIRGKVIVFVVMPEIAALFGFVTAIMLLTSGNVF